MSVMWLVFMLVIGRILATSATFADRFAAMTSRPRRFVWLTGLVATVLWPVIAIGMLQLATLALAHGWGIGAPRDAALVRLSVPRVIAPAWVDTVFLIAWACATVVLLVRLVIAARAANRWRHSLPLADVDGVEVRLTRDTGPAIVGFRTTDLLLPQWALILDPRMRSLIVRHERLHREAGDTRLFWCAVLLPVLVPWNAFAWWQANRLRLAIEMDCDARVLREDPRPVDYAKLLVSIAERRAASNGMPRFAPGLLGEPSRLEYRLAAITQAHSRCSSVRSTLNALVAAIGLVVAMGIAAPGMSAIRSLLRTPIIDSRPFRPIGR